MIRIFKIMRPKFKILAFVTIILTMLQVACFLLSPNFYGTIVSLIANSNSSSSITIQIIGNIKFNVASPLEGLKWVAIIFLIVILIGTFSSLGAAYLANYIGLGHSRDLRNKLWDNILSFSKKEIDKFTHSNLITRFTTDIARVRFAVTNMLRMLIIGPINMIFGITLSLFININLSLILVALIPVLVIVMGITSWKLLPRFKKEIELAEKLNLETSESILGIRVIKSFNLENIQDAKFMNVNNGFANMVRGNYYGINIAFSLIFLFANLAIAFLLGIIGLKYKGTLDKQAHTEMIRNINIFINYIFVVVQGIMTTTFISFNIARGVRSSKKLFEVLDTKTSIPFVASNKKIVKGNIVFKDVTFAYEDKNIIEHISFEIKPGETLGIIGPTGSGKSTITNLINRDYLTKHGQILIDGNDISELDTISLVTNISYVYQVPALINASIKENLLFANANATEEDIERATKAACAYDFINKFPQKFDYVLEPKATNLSGGQKQRLSVAQGLIKHPKILMLDDFTSALDAKTEAKVKANINEQFKDTTKIIISQKISAIKDATKILVMHHGKLDGYGTHEQLLKTNKLYKEIADVQQESVGGK